MRPSRMRSAGLLAAVVAAALLAAAPARADTVTDWNQHAIDTLVTPLGMPQAPTVLDDSSRHGARRGVRRRELDLRRP